MSAYLSKEQRAEIAALDQNHKRGGIGLTQVEKNLLAHAEAADETLAERDRRIAELEVTERRYQALVSNGWRVDRFTPPYRNPPYFFVEGCKGYTPEEAIDAAIGTWEKKA